MYFLFETHGSDDHFCPKPNGSRTTMSNELVLNFCTNNTVMCCSSAGPTMVLHKRNSYIIHHQVDTFRHDLHGYKRIFGDASRASWKCHHFCQTKLHARCISVKNRGCRAAAIFSIKNRGELVLRIFFQKHRVSDGDILRIFIQKQKVSHGTATRIFFQ